MKGQRDSKGRFIKGSSGFTGKHTEETKIKLSKSGTGRTPWNKGTKGVMKANSTSFKKGHKNWIEGTKGIHQSSQTEFKKGVRANPDGEFKRQNEDLSYGGLHNWIERKRGKASTYSCLFCQKKAKEWANVSLEYKEDVNDWMPLCKKCHVKYDREKGWGKATRKYNLGRHS